MYVYRFKLSTRKVIVSPVNKLTGALHGLQYVLNELSDYVTPRMVTSYYDARSISFSHSNTHLCRFLPYYLCKVAYKRDKKQIYFT